MLDNILVALRVLNHAAAGKESEPEDIDFLRACLPAAQHSTNKPQQLAWQVIHQEQQRKQPRISTSGGEA